MSREAILESFSRSGFATLVLSVGGAVVHRSPELTALLARNDAAQLKSRLDEIAGVLPLVGPGLRSAESGLDLRASMSIRCGSEWHRLFLVEMAPGLLAPEATVLVAVLRSWGLPFTPTVLSAHFGLSEREAEVAFHIARGLSNKNIAALLGISPNTARNHTDQVLRKLGVRSRAEATVLVHRDFTVPPEPDDVPG